MNQKRLTLRGGEPGHRVAVSLRVPMLVIGIAIGASRRSAFVRLWRGQPGR